MKHIYLYTDGACAGNPGRGGWAAVAFNEEGDNIMQHGGGFRHTTNNRMEILAVIEGLGAVCKQLRECTRDTDIKVTVYSDSQLVVNTVNLGWSKKTNNDLWDRLDDTLLFWGAEFEIRFEKVKGHSTNQYNNLANQVAVSFSSTSMATGIDTVYENISPAAPAEPKGDLLPAMKENPDHVPVYEAEVLEIRLLNANVPDMRLVEVDLSNGTTVKIHGVYGGFQQYNCTTAESAITVDIAHRFTAWLNGKKL